jgi:hypothetical protein
MSGESGFINVICWTLSTGLRVIIFYSSQAQTQGRFVLENQIRNR